MQRSGLISTALLAAALLAGPAAARQAGEPFTDLMNRSTHAGAAQQAAATITAPSVRLPRSSQDWIEAEAARQAENPRRLAQIALDVDEALGDDIVKAARRQRVGSGDLTAAVLLSVMYGAREIVERQTRGQADDPAAAARLARAEADFQAVLPLQTQVSLHLAAAR